MTKQIIQIRLDAGLIDKLEMDARVCSVSMNTLLKDILKEHYKIKQSKEDLLLQKFDGILSGNRRIQEILYDRFGAHSTDYDS